MTYVRLLNPTPVPEVTLPAPNGYEDFVEAGHLLNSTILENPETATQMVLKAEVAKYQHVFEVIRRGLERDCLKPVQYGSESMNFDDIDAMRLIARALQAEGRAAQLGGDFRQAARSYSDMVRLGCAVERGGLVVDATVAFAIEGIGLHSLIDILNALPSTDYRRLLGVLLEVDNSREPYKQFIRRDHIWIEHAKGWQGRFDVALLELSDEDIASEQALVNAQRRTATMRRLLIAEMAIRAFQLENGHAPDTLAELIPAYLTAVPRDPYGDGPLIYRRDNQSRLLYSIGPDGVDDGGKELTYRELHYEGKPGDLFMESFLDEADGLKTGLK